jgi:hypothetical protein
MRAQLDRSNPRRMLSRVRGRAALERRIRSLVIGVHRYGRCRACSRADMLWCARTIDALTAALNAPSDAEVR